MGNGKGRVVIHSIKRTGKSIGPLLSVEEEEHIKYMYEKCEELRKDEEGFKESLQYMRDCGVVFADSKDPVYYHKYFGPNAKGYHEYAGGLQAMVANVFRILDSKRSRYNIPTLVKEFHFSKYNRLNGEGESLATYHADKKHIIFYIPLMQERYEDFPTIEADYRYGWLSAFGDVGVLAHEYGHALYYGLKYSHGYTLDSFLSKTKRLRSNSAYGNSSAEEAFAEAFASYVTGSNVRTNAYISKFDGLMKEVGFDGVKDIFVPK